ncbi:MAG: alginate lyase family protein [Armatimonadota bacterium]
MNTHKMLRGITLIAIIAGLLCMMSAACSADTDLAYSNEKSPPNRKNAGSAALPGPFLHDDKSLSETRKRISAGDPQLSVDVAALHKMADDLMTAGPWSVTSKTAIPPSGDKHDYLSQAPYWWPNPNTPDGRAYIQKDGEVNPERDKLDSVPLGQMCNAVNTLSSAFWVTRYEPYAERALFLLRTWFIDEQTRMNPNLNYAQGVPGIWEGTSWGIIDTHVLVTLFDSISMLHTSRAWTKADADGLRRWASDYMQWLLTSRNGKAERGTRNNHSTWYDAQVTALAIYCGDKSTARQILLDCTRRIARQIEPEGSQPEELMRTRPLHYAIYSLHAWFFLALMGERLDLDIWRFQTDDGRSIHKALDWMLPYLEGEKSLKELDAVPFNPDETAFILRIAALKYDDRRYEVLLQKLKPAPSKEIMSQIDLLYPKQKAKTP